MSGASPERTKMGAGTNEWVTPLARVRKADVSKVGGKAAGLGEALFAGERVPAGFVLLPAAFEAIMAENGLAAEYGLALAAARRDEFGLATALVPRIEAANWPVAVLEAALSAAEGLGVERVAVRSSATLEDTEASAAAGLYHSQLDVRPAELPVAANRCWAAALQEPALAHALAMGQDPAQGQIALLVQGMIEARTAGVAFGVDPTDPTHTLMRVGVVAGRGEALVQGDAGVDFTLPREGRLAPQLKAEYPWLTELRAVVLRLEKRFGRALDLEFAWDGRLHILQVRPIATLLAGQEQRPAIRWSRDLAEERFPDPISTMGWSVLQGAFRTNLATLDRRFGLRARRPEEVATVMGGYVYNNRDFFAIPGSLRFRLEAHKPFVRAYLTQGLRLLRPGALRHLRLLRAPKRGTLGAGIHDPRFLAVACLFEAFVFVHADEVEAAWTRDFPDLIARLDALGNENFRAMDDESLQAFIDRRILALDAYMEPDLAIYVLKSACRWLVEEIGVLVRSDREANLIPRLTGGLTANATLQMNSLLEELHTAVAKDTYLATALRLGDRGALPGAWVRASARPARDLFLANYGHVTLSWDVRHPPLVEKPELLDDLLAQRLRTPMPPRSETLHAALVAAREAEIERLAAQLAPVDWAPTFLRRLVRTLHAFMRLDEEHHLFCSRALPTDRRLLAEIARRLIARGAIDGEDDIFFVSMDEARAMLRETNPHSRRRLVQRRRSAFIRASQGRPVEAYLGDRPVTDDTPIADSNGRLAGLGASPGVVEGVVRIVTTLADMAAFQPGEILVVPTPKPSFTPLFAIASGLITARGSMLSHGLITAREYGLPAITEVPNLLERLKTGQHIRMNGTTGTISLSEQPAPAVRGAP